MNRCTALSAAPPLMTRVRDAVLSVEPSARVILFGSRARGDAEPDSDWDILILLDGEISREREAEIRHRLLQLELETGEVLSWLAYSNSDWESPLYRALPLHWGVDRDGIDLTAGGQRLVPATGDRPPDLEELEQRMTPEREQIIRYELSRAHDALRAATALADVGLWNDCVNRLYYACFSAASALLLARGQGSSKHTGIRSLFNQHLGRSGEIPADLVALYNTLFKKRNVGDYGRLVRFDEAEVRPLSGEARRFVAHAEALLERAMTGGQDD